MKFSIDEVSAVVHRLFIGAPGTALRREDHKKVAELVALLEEVGRVCRAKQGTLVDLCAGKSPLGLVAAAMVLPKAWRVVVVDRDPVRIEAARTAATRIEHDVAVVVGDVGSDAVDAVIAGADVAVALHACGPASDHVIDAVIRNRPAHALVVPCCYGAHPKNGGTAIPGQRLLAAPLVDVLPRQGVVGRRMAQALIDAERTLRLETGGYDVDVLEFVSASVTPHNLLWRCRRGLDARRVDDARTRHVALHETCARASRAS